MREVTAFGFPFSRPGCKCGLAKRRPVTRIIGGQEAEVNEWPWQAGIVLKGSSNLFCGGTVISDLWILTAAHCVNDKSATQIQVLLAEHNLMDSNEPVRMDISDIILHADYSVSASGKLDQDFALLRMVTKIDWNANPNIRPVCLPDASAGDYDQTLATTTGWGRTSLSGTKSNVLLEANVKVITDSECQQRFYFSGITSNMLCAEDASGNGGSNPCLADSGGPLVTCGDSANCGTTTGNNYDLIGVVSYGSNCRTDIPAVYARVTAAREWIDDKAAGWESGTCPRF